MKQKKYSWNIESTNFSQTEYLKKLREKVFGNLQTPFVSGATAFSQQEYLQLLPNPFLLLGVKEASEAIVKAIAEHKPIVVYADYDVDGTTSAALIKLFMEELSVNVDVYIPDRLTEGYGLSVIGIEKIFAKYSHSHVPSSANLLPLIITVDNGISAFAGCLKAKELGIDVIVTDHHALAKNSQNEDLLPEALAIINPKQTACEFPEKMLAGVGVAFFLLMGIRATIREKNINLPSPNLKKYLDFVAIGTVVDMAPLTGLNHVLCKLGMQVFEHNLSLNVRPGLKRLLILAGKNEDSGPIDASDLGFKIGPRLNAAGRLGNAQATLEVLCATQYSQQTDEAAQFLHSENSQRQALEKQMVAEAFEMAEEQIERIGQIPFAFVLYKEHWHTGVVGLVASRILEKYYRPVLAFGLLDGKIKGSGRSTQEFDLFSCLNELREDFASFGGHFHACGLSILPEKLNTLRNFLELKCKAFAEDKNLLPTLKIQAECSPSELDFQFIENCENFAPFGLGNGRPKWLLKQAKIVRIQPIGKNLDAGHARLTLQLAEQEKFELTVFGMRQEFEEIESKQVDFVVEAKIGYWKGRAKPEFRLVDYFSH